MNIQMFCSGKKKKREREREKKQLESIMKFDVIEVRFILSFLGMLSAERFSEIWFCFTIFQGSLEMVAEFLTVWAILYGFSIFFQGFSANLFQGNDWTVVYFISFSEKNVFNKKE